MTETRAGGARGEESRARALLNAYLDALDVGQAERALAELLESEAQPLIASIVRSKLAGAIPAEIEDACSEATVALMERLEDFRNSSGREPVADFQAFAAVIAYRICGAYFRRARPEFHRLRNRLRYLLETQRDLAIWEDSNGERLCGFARWRPAPGRPAPARVRLKENEAPPVAPSGDPVASVAEVFRRSGGPVPFDDLARVIAGAWGVRDAPAAAVVDSLPVASGEPSAETAIERRQWIERLWNEIAELPPRQRAALLLSLRDGNGESVTTLFAITRVAGLERMAAAVELGIEQFAEIWKELPWSDNQIAERLAITRQQVINLRKSARERLARRIFGTKGNWTTAW